MQKKEAKLKNKVKNSTYEKSVSVKQQPELHLVLSVKQEPVLHKNKVLTYVEYRALSVVFQNIDPPPPSPPSECVFPPHHRPRTHSPGGEGMGGQYTYWKTPAIGLASYNNLSTLCCLLTCLSYRLQQPVPPLEISSTATCAA
jgi:hypothetical protein